MSPLRDLLAGVGVLFQGLGIIVRHPRLFVLGAIPPLITSVLFVVAFVALVTNVTDLTAWLTPFADGWSEGWATTLRVAAGIVLIAAAVMLMVVAFTGLTLALGFPLYDKIAESVDDHLGDAPPPFDDSIARTVVRAVRQSLGLILVSLLISIPMFLAGFIPVVGQTVVPVVSGMIGGWLLTIELLSTPFERRRLLRVSDRREAMRRRRFLVWGFGIPSYLLLAVPFVAVLAFPAVTAGGTVLARRLLPPAPPAPPQAPHGYAPRAHPGQPGHPGMPPVPPAPPQGHYGPPPGPGHPGR
ncbi:EI24 domain-containing protein [Streptomonospora sp. S1-112]|uniref:EI24 domain-containing protein n=1 Tax=Streptomonospora mangrovi TaxID=2883123 RepID=A0A9X3NGF0_9ACTN|nr:EI24 domain-containing protein [Streptomonospora mangrovi]MDA0563107.1 EI24 domain-containing protein [Streptomonospora mangrovi]